MISFGWLSGPDRTSKSRLKQLADWGRLLATKYLAMVLIKHVMMIDHDIMQGQACMLWYLDLVELSCTLC